MALFEYRNTGTNQVVYLPTPAFTGDPLWELVSGGGGGGAVASVAGRSGDIVLGAGDITNGVFAAARLPIGTGAGQIAPGDDSRITGAAQTSANLSDLVNPATARTNLGLGVAALAAVGTGAGTVAAGNDSRIVGAAQKSQNLADLPDAATARTNLGLGGSAVRAVGTGAGTVAAGDDPRFTDGATAGHRLVIFYSPPQVVNALYEDEAAAAVFAGYDHIVFGDGSEDPGDAYYTSTVAIIARIHELNTRAKIFGYVNMGIGSPSVASMKVLVDQWGNAGADGILFDTVEYGYGVSRATMNTMVDYCHDADLSTIINGFVPDDVMGSAVDATYNPAGTPTSMDERDYYLLEDFVVEDDLYSATDGFSPMAALKTRVDQSRAYRTSLGVKLMSIGLVDYSTHTDAELEFFWGMQQAAALVFGIDSYGLSPRDYSADGPTIGVVRNWDYWPGLDTRFNASADYAINAGGTEATRADLGGVVFHDDTATSTYSFALPQVSVDVLPVGTAASTVAAGNDIRITGAAAKSANLSDLGSVGTARTNLGLGGAALLAVGTGAGTVAAGNDSRIVNAVPKGSLLINVKDYGALGNGSDDVTALNAALAAAPPGATVLFPSPSTYYAISAPLTVPTGVTIIGGGQACEIRQTTQLKPVFDVFNSSDVTISGFKLVNGSGSPTGVGSSFRGDSGYAYSAGVWTNGSRVAVSNMRIVDFAVGVYFADTNSAGTVNNDGVQRFGNSVDGIEVSGANHSVLYLCQTGLRIRGMYSHDHVDSSAGTNPNHAIYGSGLASLMSNDVTVADCTTANLPFGSAYQFKFVNGLKVSNCSAYNANGLFGGFDLIDAVLTGLSSRADNTTGTSAWAFTVTTVTNPSARLTISDIHIQMATDGQPMILIADDVQMSNVALYSNHTGASINNTDLHLRGNRITVDGVRINNLGNVQYRGIRVGEVGYTTSDVSIGGLECTNMRALVDVHTSVTGANVIRYDPGAQRNIGAGLSTYIVDSGGTATYSVSRSAHTNSYTVSGGTATPLAGLETVSRFNITSTSAFTIAAPVIVPKIGMVHSILLQNSSGGSLGTITWNAIYDLGPGINLPGNGTSRLVTFCYDGTKWVSTAPSNTGAPDIQEFTTAGSFTWTKPAGAVEVEVYAIGGGGGGGSGRKGAAASIRCGGGGASGGNRMMVRFKASDLSATETVVVGGGGAGGVSVTAADTNGNAGAAGVGSTFGTKVFGYPGLGGAGGTASTGTGASSLLGVASTPGAGGSASTTGGAGLGSNPGLLGAPGGGAGGGITSGDVAGNGGAGSGSYIGASNPTQGGAAGVVDTTAPTAGTAPTYVAPGRSGGGGAASITTNAQAGATSGNWGGGGGGGGASLNAVGDSGAGGAGGPGAIVVITYS